MNNNIFNYVSINDDNEKEFNNDWIVWYHKDYNDWSLNGFEKIVVIKTIDDYWTFFNNINIIGNFSQIPYYIMRSNILPLWESNQNGGDWSIKIELKNIEEIKDIFIYLTGKMFGECLSDIEKLINGISISIKNTDNIIAIIKIWINNYNKQDLIYLQDDIIKKYNIIYNSHKIKTKKNITKLNFKSNKKYY